MADYAERVRRVTRHSREEWIGRICERREVGTEFKEEGRLVIQTNIQGRDIKFLSKYKHTPDSASSQG